MRTSRTLSITLPPEMFERAAAIARKEDRTMSELVREALRHYERGQWWNEMNAYGSAKARAQGLTEADVMPMVKELRQRKKAKRTTSS